MSDATGLIIVGGMEVAKLSLQAYLTQMKLLGKTQEEIQQLFVQVSKEMDQRPADNLEKV